MLILIGADVLARRGEPAHPDHAAAVEAVARLRLDGESLYVTPQIILEIATRPLAEGGLGLSAGEAMAEVELIERLLELLPGVPAIHGLAHTAPK